MSENEAIKIRVELAYPLPLSCDAWMARALQEGRWTLGVSCPTCWKVLPPAELSSPPVAGVSNEAALRGADNCHCVPAELTTLADVLSAHSLMGLFGRMGFEPTTRLDGAAG